MASNGVLQRDRMMVLAALAVLIILSWGYTISLGLGTSGSSMSDAVAMPMMMAWSATDFFFMFVMWSVMMFAMMLPSVTPTVMIFERVRARREAAGAPFAPTMAFVSGYLLVWMGFSLAATLLNWRLHSGDMMTSMMGAVTPVLGGALLICAGLFQWTPLKDACLEHCRSPLGFLTAHWREGTRGALQMGLHHGVYCFGCCWLLMVLLFVLGVMNLVWVVVLTLIVLAEKTLPNGRVFSRGLGAGLLVWGVWLIATA